MFFSNVTIAEKYDYLDESFRAAYRWLRDTDILALPAGSYPILEERVVANVQEYTTAPESEKSFESHEKYFDIQYMVRGVERFGICRTDGLTEKERFPERDLIFYEDPDNAGFAVLTEGDLIVVAPEDAHRPGCIQGEPVQVKKVVVKVKI